MRIKWWATFWKKKLFMFARCFQFNRWRSIIISEMHTRRINVLCIFYNKNMQCTSCTWVARNISSEVVIFTDLPRIKRRSLADWRRVVRGPWYPLMQSSVMISTKTKENLHRQTSFSVYVFPQLMTTFVSSYSELNSSQHNYHLSFMYNQVPMNSFKYKSCVYSVYCAISKFKAAHLNYSLKDILIKVECQRGSLLNVCLLSNLWKSP